MSQGERGILEFKYKYAGDYMFHAHKTEFAEKGWMGLFRVLDNDINSNRNDAHDKHESFQSSTHQLENNDSNTKTEPVLTLDSLANDTDTSTGLYDNNNTMSNLDSNSSVSQNSIYDRNNTQYRDNVSLTGFGNSVTNDNDNLGET
jgi:hypothetical protein